MENWDSKIWEETNESGKLYYQYYQYVILKANLVQLVNFMTSASVKEKFIPKAVQI